MTVLIREIISEVVLAPRQDATGGRYVGPSSIDDDVIDAIVRRASARVMAELRLEWDR